MMVVVSVLSIKLYRRRTVSHCGRQTSATCSLAAYETLTVVSHSSSILCPSYANYYLSLTVTDALEFERNKLQ